MDPRSERFAGAYVLRHVDDDLDELFGPLAAVLLDGPKGVGKTETALQRAATVRRLDQPGLRQIAEADVDRMLRGDTPVLLAPMFRGVWATGCVGCKEKPF